MVRNFQLRLLWITKIWGQVKGNIVNWNFWIVFGADGAAVETKTTKT